MPGDDAYTLRVRIEPPDFMRHDKINGKRFAAPVEVEFRQVRAIHPLPEAPRLGDRSLGIVRQVRRYFDRDEAIGAIGAVIERAEQVAGVLDIGNYTRKPARE